MPLLQATRAVAKLEIKLHSGRVQPKPVCWIHFPGSMTIVSEAIVAHPNGGTDRSDQRERHRIHSEQLPKRASHTFHTALIGGLDRDQFRDIPLSVMSSSCLMTKTRRWGALPGELIWIRIS